MGSYLYSHYGYVYALDKKLATKTQKWENNDIITMIVDMKQQRILFYKNNKYMTKIESIDTCRVYGHRFV